MYLGKLNKISNKLYEKSSQKGVMVRFGRLVESLKRSPSRISQAVSNLLIGTVSISSDNKITVYADNTIKIYK